MLICSNFSHNTKLELNLRGCGGSITELCSVGCFAAVNRVSDSMEPPPTSCTDLLAYEKKAALLQELPLNYAIFVSLSIYEIVDIHIVVKNCDTLCAHAYDAAALDVDVKMHKLVK